MFGKTNGLCRLAFACLFTLCAASTSLAAPIHLQVESGGTTLDFFGAENLLLNGPVVVGDYTIAASVASSTSPSSSLGQLTITNLSVTRTGTSFPGDSVSIRLLGGPFVSPFADPLYALAQVAATFSLTSSANDSVSFQGWIDFTNTPTFETGDASPLLTLTPPASGDTAAFQVSPPMGASSYLLKSTTTVFIKNLGSFVTTAGGTLETSAEPFGPGPVPEPSTLALACMGLVSFSGYARRRMKARA